MIEKVKLEFREALEPLPKVEKVICHHPAHPTWDIYDIHNYHKNGRKWSGVGYNYFITFDGRIQEGRGRHKGAHCLGGWNSKSLGVSFQGNFQEQKMTDAQVKSGAKLIAMLLKNEGLRINDVVGHGDLWKTACPGKNFRMNDLKEAILHELNPRTKGEKTMLKRGDQGNAVKELQVELINAGMDLSTYGADGDFGAETERAVKAFQSKYGLTVDGIAGKNTFAKLEELSTPKEPESPTQEPEKEEPKKEPKEEPKKEEPPKKNESKMDKGSVARFVGLLVGVLAYFGFDVGEQLQSAIVDVAFGAYIIYVAFKNNYLTKKGNEQKAVLDQFYDMIKHEK